MGEQKQPLVYLREGHVCAFTVPLPQAVMDRWKASHLQRVTEDGQTWPGDQWVMPGGEPGPQPEPKDAGDGSAAAGDSGVPGRPKRNAPKPDWAAYAAALGACDEEKAAGLTRDQLIDLVTPPEDKHGPGEPQQ